MSSTAGGTPSDSISKPFFCYQCERTVRITVHPSSDPYCPLYNDGFVEETENPNTNPTLSDFPLTDPLSSFLSLLLDQTRQHADLFRFNRAKSEEGALKYVSLPISKGNRVVRFTMAESNEARWKLLLVASVYGEVFKFYKFESYAQSRLEEKGSQVRSSVALQQKVTYEWRPQVCQKFKLVGHLEMNCKMSMVKIWKVKGGPQTSDEGCLERSKQKEP